MKLLGSEHTLFVAVGPRAHSSSGTPEVVLSVVSALPHRAGFNVGIVVTHQMAIASAVGVRSANENPWQ